MSELSEALDRFIREERPDLGKDAAIRLLLADCLIGMGLMALPGSNRSRGARRSRRGSR